jgi:hypothetical protein
LGTSVSQRSPKNNVNWSAAITTYTSEKATVVRTVEEVWKAIKYQQDSSFVKDLGSPIILKCLQIALKEILPEQVSTEVSRTVALSGKSSIAADIAKRAAVFSNRNPQDRINSFVQYLFSKASDYLVSRDLSGYVGSITRIRNISASIEYKNTLEHEVRRVVNGYPLPKGLEENAEIWNTYVDAITLTLAGLGKDGI